MKRLYIILSILARSISPAADFNIHLAVILIPSCVVKGEHRKNHRWLEMRRITHDERIGSVSQTTRQRPLGPCPLPGLFRYPKMKPTVGIGPRIRWVVVVDGVPAGTWRITAPPLVAAEAKRRSHRRSRR